MSTAFYKIHRSYASPLIVCFYEFLIRQCLQLKNYLPMQLSSNISIYKMSSWQFVLSKTRKLQNTNRGNLFVFTVHLEKTLNRHL